jgi:hypothetical protein
MIRNVTWLMLFALVWLYTSSPNQALAGDAAYFTGRMTTESTTTNGIGKIAAFHGATPDSMSQWVPHWDGSNYYWLQSTQSPAYLPYYDYAGLVFWSHLYAGVFGGSGGYTEIDKCDVSGCVDLDFWHSSGYYASAIKYRVVAGDFGGDPGQDVAAFYDYGGCTTKVHVWLRNSQGNLVYQGSSGWWASSGFCSSAINGRVVSGKFLNGNKDDIAVMYDLGGFTSKIMVLKNFGSGFGGTSSGSGYLTWYSTQGLAASRIGGRLESGSFDGDGKYDDIVGLYDNGDGTSSILEWTSTGSGFTYQGAVWSGNYNPAYVDDRFVSGNFNVDANEYGPADKCTDLAAMFDLESSYKINVWLSDCDGTFTYQGGAGWPIY